jgi:Salt tolerance down-regulator
MNDTIKDSIKQIEVLCFLFFWFLIFNRNAIEEELEVLYDAYYDELENYANIQQLHVSTGGASSPPPGPSRKHRSRQKRRCRFPGTSKR